MNAHNSKLFYLENDIVMIVNKSVSDAALNNLIKTINSNFNNIKEVPYYELDV